MFIRFFSFFFLLASILIDRKAYFTIVLAVFLGWRLFLRAFKLFLSIPTSLSASKKVNKHRTSGFYLRVLFSNKEIKKLFLLELNYANGWCFVLELVLSGELSFSPQTSVTYLKMQMPDRNLMVTFLVLTGNFSAGNVLVGGSLRKMKLLVCKIEVQNTFKMSKQKLQF